ncbi:hypothetical protein BBBOND_0206750 [Babesia bigemina]|uniref:6-Cys domain-containing protein n=1 Tax=Babesia bigemina TaxID=5866 RepID=A0A061D673_BABBI|nr:hypothetical protein BBBOND_0206750 [Babesia bigemina]CDR95517.1 hypothetical protein BBBOND_0206750 [Babesia bigemina]|eukprot:XP_012767703.1 hypothetical protein BBBOND_0206750 [Babesia bigemina]
MGIYQVKVVFTSFIMILTSVRHIDALFCDFGGPSSSIRTNALVACHLNMEIYSVASVSCPHQVGDMEYIWHPSPTLDAPDQMNAYVSGYDALRSVAIANILHSESDIQPILLESIRSQNIIHVDVPKSEFIAITEQRLIFICGPRHMVLSDAFQRHLDRLDDAVEIQTFHRHSSSPLGQDVANMGYGMGVFYLNRGRAHLPLQGCGSRPSPLFAADNEVTVDSNTGVRSCVANPMSISPIGFVCEGRIQPEECMRSLFDQKGEVVATPEPHKYWNFDNHRPWVIAQYFDKLALPPIKGECRCIDPETGDTKATIVVRSKTDYVCDISSKIFRDRHRSIIGPWCSVVLHPGSTLTIKVPTQPVKPILMGDYYDRDIDEDVSGVPFSQLPSAYEYETEFLPNNLATLRQLKSIHDIDDYKETMYSTSLAGDALELDVSLMNRGEVTLKYNQDKPLTMRLGPNSFLFHWTLIARNKNVPDKIRAIVNVALAFTHHYQAVGCDRGSQRLFAPYVTKKYCVTKRWGNGIGETYECTYNRKLTVSWAGIHCSPDEELLPANCDSTGYDLYSNSIIGFPVSVHHATAIRMPGFQMLGFKNQNSPASYACVCVDARGYEKSRLILESSSSEQRMYIVNREEAIDNFVYHMLLPWHEAELSSEETSVKYLVLNSVSQESVVLGVGKTLFTRCTIEQGAYEDVNGDNIRPMWLPASYRNSHYTIRQTAAGPELVLASHRDSITTTPGGFEVFPMFSSPSNYELGIKSHKGAALISKDPDNTKYVPITFVCGKVPETSDVSVVTGDVLPSGGYAMSNNLHIGSSQRYKWHVVEVAVETTDPYMQGCGVTYESAELFKPETTKIHDADGQEMGCEIDIETAKEAAFYCPAPYVLDPPNCFDQVYVNGEVKNLTEISKSLIASASNHFVTLLFDSARIGPGETLHQTPPLECRCVTTKGIVLSTIQIENYYSK